MHRYREPTFARRDPARQTRTGGASEFRGLLVAVPVCSTIASGRLVSLDIADAEAMPGVHAVLHRDNIGRFYRLSGNSMETGFVDEARPPFEDDIIRYYGQYIAVVIADQGVIWHRQIGR